MKKILITLAAIAALSLFVTDYGFGKFGVDLKRKACEKSCDAAYKNCKERAEKSFEKCKENAKKIQDQSKRKAEEIGCLAKKETKILAGKKTKDECYKKCN